MGISKLPMWSILSVCTSVQRVHLTFIFGSTAITDGRKYMVGECIGYKKYPSAIIAIAE
jgi:hypothetical protein